LSLRKQSVSWQVREFRPNEGKERVNAQHSMKQALQGVKSFAQEPTLGIFRLFAVLQHIPNSTADRKDLQQSCKMAALARHLCLPIPAILVLIAAGALANYLSQKDIGPIAF
jgi:hypothetical protein